MIPDFRPPNIVRLAPVAMYNTFGECIRAVGIIERIMETGNYQSMPSERDLVT